MNILVTILIGALGAGAVLSLKAWCKRQGLVSDSSSDSESDT